MTLTEEQRGTVAFDLERARGLRDFLQDDCAEVGDVWGEMIAEIERLRAENEEALESLTAAYLLGRHEKAQEVAARPKEGKIDSSEHVTEPTKMIGFDLEKARAEVATASARRFSESREQARIFCAEEILPDALDEIERLRPFEIAARDLDSDITKIAGERDEQAARIRELGGMLSIRTEELEIAHSCARSEREMHEKELVVFARKIAELEDALVEERTGAIRCESYDHCEGMYRIDLPDAMIRAQQELQAEGKIGPDAAKPRVWQITEERKAAIWHAVAVLKENDPDDEHLWDEEIAVLRTMLTEAE